eukprot:comp20233_c1_seq1/m.25228 comp20233_c1_seq1/g.25228  ORF comp20233_c1_seq1/g.25228 comp20233_c1_seq1/m.25228 type:complete len:238 (-) comp20233_c1_seq1:207-920(-)
MKFLDVPELMTLASRLNTVVGDRQLSCWLEAYSMKHAGTDKKQYKQYSTQNGGTLQGLELLSPPQTFSATPPNNSLITASKKTLYYLMATLNSVFTDYDFSGTGSQQFSREPNVELVAHAINTTLLEGARDAFLPIRNSLWQCLNDQIDLASCEIYSYIPVMDDPFAEDGTIWSFNYFFVNPKLKRVLFFSCRAISMSAVCSYDPMFDTAANDAEEESIFGLEMDMDRTRPAAFAVY